jgi:hypothetical protein
MTASFANKHYTSGHKRFLGSAVERLLEQHIPQAGGPEIRRLLAGELVGLFNTFTKPYERLRPGQMLWVAVDRDTRPDATRVRYNPVVLTVVTPDEVSALADNSTSPVGLLGPAFARILNEAHLQHSLLSMRDLGLIYKRQPTDISQIRKQYELRTGQVLPTPATIQDMGSGVTHKAMILRKVLIEKKDMAKVREETHHGQSAIDHYLKSYRRVEMLLDDDKDTFYISQVTGLSPFLIMQYETIYREKKATLNAS